MVWMKRHGSDRAPWVGIVLGAAIFAFGLALALHYNRRGLGFPDQVLAVGWRLLTGQVPFRDFSLVQGLTVGVLQVPFFKFFGVNLFSTILHGAVINGLAGVLVFGLLQSLGLGRAWSFFYGTLTCVVFYTGWSHPFTTPHGYFFSLVILALQAAALKSPRPGPVAVAYGLAGIAAVLSYYSKPVPFGFFLPLFACMWLFVEGRLKGVAVAAGIAGALLALSPLASVAGLDGQTWHRIWFYSFVSPLGVGGSRFTGATGLYALAKTIASTYRFNMASFILLFAAIVVSVVLVLRAAVRGSPRDLPKDAIVAFLVGSWTVAAMLLLQVISQYPYFDGLQLMFLSVGCLQLAVCRLTGAPPATGADILSGPHRSDSPAMAITGLFAVVALMDALFFHAMVNEQRGWTHDWRIDQRIAEVPRVPGLDYIQFYTWTAKTGAGVLRLTADDVRAELDGILATIDFLKEDAENVLFTWPNTIAFMAAGKPEIMPVLNVIPGYASPLPGTSEFADFTRSIERNIAKYKVRRVVVPPEKAKKHAERIAQAAGIVCGRELKGAFYVLRLCQPAAAGLGDFIAVLVGATERRQAVLSSTLAQPGKSGY
jgi:hypothetical protein